MHHISAPISSESPELVHSFGNSKADRTEDITSHGKTVHTTVQMVSPSECLTVDQVNEEIPTTERALILHIPNPNDSQEPHYASNSTNAPVGSSAINTAPPSTPTSPIIPVLQAMPHENTPSVDTRPWLLNLRKTLHCLITKHPKVMSTISTVLIIMGSLVLLPGLSACVNGTILAHPAVKVAAGVTVAVGKWLRSAVAKATT